MTGESQGRQAQRMSRFSQAYRTMPLDAAVHATLDERAERALDRADAMSEGWHRPAGSQPYADVIEVEFETVQPLPPAADPVSDIRYEAAPEPETQPVPPDIEAIAAALAAEMDRNAARTQHQNGAAQEMPPAPEPQEPEVEAAVAATEAVPPTTPALPAPPERLTDKLAGKLTGKLPDQLLEKALEAARFARAKAVPALGAAALWAAHNLRRKEIRRRYGKGLALLHGRVLDRKLEQHFYVPTLAVQRFGPDLDRGIVYEGPVPSAAFAWALSLAPENLREYAFVDFRAGRGRAMLLASQRNFERIVGYEYDAALHDDLQMNIAQFPRSKMVCRDVQCFRGDRTGVSIPDQPCVLYFSGAWREELLPGIMNYVRESYRHKPRRIYVILENVDDSVVLPPDEVFHRMELPVAEKLKLRLFSPMDFQVYRSQI
jgi:hypothetical protein